MNYITKGEFIQTLKDYHYIEELLENERRNYDNLYYLRYEKVKSPLDYDIAGYDKNNSVIRVVKGRGHTDSEIINSNHEKLDRKLSLSQERIDNYKSVLCKCDNELLLFSEPLKTILVLRYKEHYKLRKLCKVYKEMYLDESTMYKYIMKELDKYYTPR